MRVLSLQRSTQRKESGIIILGKSGLVRSVPSDIKIVTMSLTTSKLSGWNPGIWFYLLHWETFQVLLVLLWEYKAFVPFTNVDSSSVYGRWWRWDSGKSSDHRGPACKGDVGAPLPSFLSSWTWVDELCSALSGWALLCSDWMRTPKSKSARQPWTRSSTAESQWLHCELIALGICGRDGRVTKVISSKKSSWWLFISIQTLLQSAELKEECSLRTQQIWFLQTYSVLHRCLAEVILIA